MTTDTRKNTVLGAATLVEPLESPWLSQRMDAGDVRSGANDDPAPRFASNNSSRKSVLSALGELAKKR